MSAVGLPAAPAHPRARRRASSGCACCSRSPAFLVGLGIILFWVGCALFGRLFVDPLADDILNTLAPPSAEHWFGTDELGRDMFARVIAGSRDILVVAPLATLLGIALGTALGLVMGFFPGWSTTC